MLDPVSWLHESALRRHWQWLLVALMGVVSWLAFAPQPAEPHSLTHVDKLEHAAAFATLTAVALLASRPGLRISLQVALGMLGYGAFIELVQTFLPTRQGDWPDLLADAVGIAIGLTLVRWARLRWPASTPSS